MIMLVVSWPRLSELGAEFGDKGEWLAEKKGADEDDEGILNVPNAALSSSPRSI